MRVRPREGEAIHIGPELLRAGHPLGAHVPAYVALDLETIEAAPKGPELMDPCQGDLKGQEFSEGPGIEVPADLLATSPATVIRQWAGAHARLQRQLIDEHRR